MIDRLRRLSRLTPTEFFMLLQAFAGLIAVQVLLRPKGFARSIGFFDRFASIGLRPAPPGGEVSRIAITVRLVDAAASTWPLRPHCLSRAIVLRWLLARQGIPVELRVGVREDQGRIAGHAWVEWQHGSPVGERADVVEIYSAFPGDVAAVARWVE